MNKYLSDSLLKQESERQGAELLGKLIKRPTFSFAVFAVVMILIQALSKAGLIGSSFVNAVGSTLIFCIVGLGFCLLLGYSALASLGTAGFIAIGAYSAYYCLAEWDRRDWLLRVLTAVLIG